jgi:hypothetical protein
MRRILLAVLSTITSAGLMFGVAAAQSSSCSVIDTGPNSKNTCEVSNNNTIKVSCNNSADVVFVNGQSANSGSVNVTNNNSGGYAYSGNAVNKNSTTGKLDVSCAAKTAAAPTPSPTTSPAGCQGAASAKPTTPAQAQSLPNTGSSLSAKSSITAAVIIVAVALGARFGLSAYRRLALK